MSESTAAGAGRVQIGDRFVNRMGFGAMRVTGPGVWGDPPDRPAAHRLLRRVVERGVTFIDTADSYGPEVSELVVAEALHPYPEEVVIATKGGLVRPGPGRWEPDCRPEHLREACEGSLRRLRVETIDVHQLHTVDPKVPFEESVGALRDLQAEGKIRHIGLSNVTVEHLERASELVEVVSVQNRYNLADRDAEPVLEACERRDIAFIPWFPLGAGELTATSGRMRRVARRHDSSPAQLVLAWLLHRSPKMLVIPGTSSLEHFEENVAAALLELDETELTAIEQAAGR